MTSKDGKGLVRTQKDYSRDGKGIVRTEKDY